MCQEIWVVAGARTGAASCWCSSSMEKCCGSSFSSYPSTCTVKNSKVDIFGRALAPAPPIKMRQSRCCNMGLHDINQFSNHFYLNRSILKYICTILIN
jgi:hypothetical protein